MSKLPALSKSMWCIVRKTNVLSTIKTTQRLMEFDGWWNDEPLNFMYCISNDVNYVYSRINKLR